MEGHWLPDNLISIKIPFSSDNDRIMVCRILISRLKIGNLVNSVYFFQKFFFIQPKISFFMNLSDWTIQNHIGNWI